MIIPNINGKIKLMFQPNDQLLGKFTNSKLLLYLAGINRSTFHQPKFHQWCSGAPYFVTSLCESVGELPGIHRISVVNRLNQQIAGASDGIFCQACIDEPFIWCSPCKKLMWISCAELFMVVHRLQQQYRSLAYIEHFTLITLTLVRLSYSLHGSPPQKKNKNLPAMSALPPKVKS